MEDSGLQTYCDKVTPRISKDQKTREKSSTPACSSHWSLFGFLQSTSESTLFLNYSSTLCCWHYISNNSISAFFFFWILSSTVHKGSQIILSDVSCVHRTPVWGLLRRWRLLDPRTFWHTSVNISTRLQQQLLPSLHIWCYWLLIPSDSSYTVVHSRSKKSSRRTLVFGTTTAHLKISASHYTT